MLPLRTIGIAGPGLIGGSLALAARAAGLEVLVWSHDPEEVLQAEVAGLAASTDPASLAAAELVALCVPIAAQADVADLLARHLSAEATVTDVASVKAPLAAPLRALFGPRYVGAHPMAGNERSGFGAASPELFRGRPCFLDPAGEPAHVARAERFWRLVGCEPRPCAAAEHDAIVARISHLPVLVAAALVNAAARRADCLPAAGPGFMDSTRVAGSPPALWQGIFLANREAVREALSAFREELEVLEREALTTPAANNLPEALDRAAQARRGLGKS